MRKFAIVAIASLAVIACSRGGPPADATPAELGSATRGVPPAALGARADFAGPGEDADAIYLDPPSP